MKKVLIMLVSAVMLFSMTACSSKKSEEIQEPGIENSEEKASVSSEVPQKQMDMNMELQKMDIP